MRFIILLVAVSGSLFAENYYFVKKPLSAIYLSPANHSEVLQSVGFGEYLKKEETLKKRKGWVFVANIGRLTGWIRLADVTEISKANRYKVVLREVNSNITNPHLRFEQLEKIAQYLFSISENTDFSGEEFLHLKIKGGIFLARCLNIYNEASEEFKAKNAFIKNKYSRYILVTPESIQLEPQFYWSIADVNQRSRAGDYAAFLAVKYYSSDCDSVFCSLKRLNETKIKYLRLFAQGNYARRFNLELEKELTELLAKKDYCAEFPKSKPVLLDMRKQLLEVPARFSVKNGEMIDTFLEDCGD